LVAFFDHKALFSNLRRWFLVFSQPAVVVRPHPKLFKLPTHALNESKENFTPDHNTMPSSNLPYRSLFAVLTVDSVLVYDTHHNRPLALVKGLHYAALTDCCWSPDGKDLILCSSDGYVSLVHFADGELGELYEPPKVQEVFSDSLAVTNDLLSENLPREFAPLPRCEPSNNKGVIEAPPAKRAKKTRIVPVLLSSLPTMSSSVTTATTVQDSNKGQHQDPVSREISPAKRTAEQQWDNETDRMGLAVTKLSLDSNTVQPPKKKKRIQPTLISFSNA
jgi:chromatin assembly factor 1 subunit B